MSVLLTAEPISKIKNEWGEGGGYRIQLTPPQVHLEASRGVAASIK